MAGVQGGGARRNYEHHQARELKAAGKRAEEIAAELGRKLASVYRILSQGQGAMSWRYQKRIRVLPGLHLNLSKSGVGVSIGGRGAHVGWTVRGRRYVGSGVAGTGLSWREYDKRRKVQPMVRPAPCELCQPGHAHVEAWVVAAIVGLVVLAALGVAGR